MARNAFYEGGLQSAQGVVKLGVSSVTTGTHIVAAVPKKMRITAIRYYVQSAATATALTAQVFARTTAGATGNSLNSDTSIDTTAALGKAGIDTTLTTTSANLVLDAGQLLEVVVTASTASAGPGDLLVVVEGEPLV